MKKLSIGKAPNNDIVISNDLTVSRSHACLIIDGEISISDLNSTNGTHVNGIRINGTQVLEPLDVVRVGNSLVDWASYNDGKTIVDFNHKKHEKITEGNLNISDSIRESLDIMIYWGKFLSVLGYILIGLMILRFISFFSNTYYIYDDRIIFISLLMLALYYFPTSFLYKFSVKTRKALNSDSQSDVELGLTNLSYLFKFLGILTIVVLSLIVIISIDSPNRYYLL